MAVPKASNVLRFNNTNFGPTFLSPGGKKGGPAETAGPDNALCRSSAYFICIVTFASTLPKAEVMVQA